MDLIDIYELLSKKAKCIPFIELEAFHGRMRVIGKTIKKIGAKNYLEIGVFEGNCFLQISAFRKIAIDPKIIISKKKELITLLLNPLNYFNKYINMKSDKFFNQISSSQKKEWIDVAFIDGLHTYEQSLRDVQNILRNLKQGGVIIMHDCNPLSKEMAYSIEPGNKSNIPQNDWCGDVWKAIVHLRSIRDDLDIFVLNFDYGVGLIYKKNNVNSNSNETDLDLLENRIELLDYTDLDSNRKEFLNLKNEAYLEQFLKNIYKKNKITSKIYSVFIFIQIFILFWIFQIYQFYKLFNSFQG